MTYAEAIQFLYGLQLFGAQLGLERPFRLAELAGHPQNELRFIHVAGTNGKGSTCAMLESIYRAAGLRVGLYTSPHLVSFRERIQINRGLISEEEAARFVADLQQWLKEFPHDNHPTFFEAVTIMALRHFAENKCDLVIWETGLGGRLDATNIVTPLASVITNVQLDHEAWLGSTIEEIAREKAGIIKACVPVITAATDETALRVIAQTAEHHSAPLHLVRTIEITREIGLRGDHQLLNAALALETVEVLKTIHPISEAAIDAGLKSVEWPGRFQVIKCGGQTLILDGAHNPAGAVALASALCAEAFHPLTLILGILADKNCERVCQILAPLAVRILAVPVASNRTARPEALVEFCRRANPNAEVAAETSLRGSLHNAARDPFVVLAGSLYLIGEALELLGEHTAANERTLNEWSVRSG